MDRTKKATKHRHARSARLGENKNNGFLILKAGPTNRRLQEVDFAEVPFFILKVYGCDQFLNIFF
jgi:hypothetical protein